MLVILDRFENNYAVCECEDRTMININVDKLPDGVCEGDVLEINGDEIKINYNETIKRKEKIAKLTKDLWN